MKLYVTSDLHLEFADLRIPNRDGIDMLILSGDIMVAQDLDRPDERGDRVQDFLRHVSAEYPEVIMVMGNHEHYHGDFARTKDLIQQSLDRLELRNVHLLERESLDIGGYLFLGGTLWTDCNRQDPLTMMHVKERMSDHRHIKNSAVSFYRFLPEHAVSEHHAMVKFVTDTIDQRRAAGDESRRVVVVGHHAPSRASTHPRYRGDYYLNGAYSSNLDDFILDRPEIVLWTHGHTHEDFDYQIGNTRIVCTPRGYHGYEPRTDTWQPKLVEL
jgi:predicted phosphodiesterase